LTQLSLRNYSYWPNFLLAGWLNFLHSTIFTQLFLLAELSSCWLAELSSLNFLYATILTGRTFFLLAG
jgi:hypothetical protein